MVGWCQAADHLAMYDADITGVQFFELPGNEVRRQGVARAACRAHTLLDGVLAGAAMEPQAALSGGCVFDGTTGYFGGVFWHAWRAGAACVAIKTCSSKSLKGSVLYTSRRMRVMHF